MISKEQKEKVKGIVVLEKKIPEFELKVSQAEEEFSSLQEKKITGIEIDPKAIKVARESWEMAKEDLQFAKRTLEKLNERLIKSIGEEKERNSTRLGDLSQQRMKLEEKYAEDLFRELVNLCAKMQLIFGPDDYSWLRYFPVIGPRHSIADFTKKVDSQKTTINPPGRSLKKLQDEIHEINQEDVKGPEVIAEELLTAERSAS